MARVLVQSFLHGEVAVGIVLTLALLTGQAHPQTLALTLGGIGVFFLLQAMLPALRRPSTTRRISEAVRDPHGRPIPAAWTNCAQAAPKQVVTSNGSVAKKPSNLPLIRGFATSGVVLATALLIYYIAPLPA